MVLRLLEVVLEGLPQLVVRRRRGHLGQGLDELLLGAVEVAELLGEEVVDRLHLHRVLLSHGYGSRSRMVGGRSSALLLLPQFAGISRKGAGGRRESRMTMRDTSFEGRRPAPPPRCTGDGRHRRREAPTPHRGPPALGDGAGRPRGSAARRRPGGGGARGDPRRRAPLRPRGRPRAGRRADRPGHPPDGQAARRRGVGDELRRGRGGRFRRLRLERPRLALRGASLSPCEGRRPASAARHFGRACNPRGRADGAARRGRRLDRKAPAAPVRADGGRLGSRAAGSARAAVRAVRPSGPGERNSRAARPGCAQRLGPERERDLRGARPPRPRRDEGGRPGDPRREASAPAHDRGDGARGRRRARRAPGTTLDRTTRGSAAGALPDRARLDRPAGGGVPCRRRRGGDRRPRPPAHARAARPDARVAPRREPLRLRLRRRRLGPCLEQDPERERGLAAALDELDRRVQVDVRPRRQLLGLPRREACTRELLAPPGLDLDRVVRCRFRPVRHLAHMEARVSAGHTPASASRA